MAFIATIATGLGVGLARKVGGEIGARLIGSVFPPSVPTYFDEVYREISRIVKAALTEVEIEKINGLINSTQEWVRLTYLEHAGDWPARQKLHELQVKLDRLGPAIGLLQDPAFAEAGFSVFMVAGGLQLALLQEQVLVASKASDPGHLAYVHTMHQTAQLRFDFAIDALIRVLRQARDKKVGRRLLKDLENPAGTALNWLSLKLSHAASPLCRSFMTNVNGYFFDYSTIEGYVERAGIGRWTEGGIYGWMASRDGKQPGADVPFYRLEAADDPKRVLIAFDERSYAAAQKVGWNGNGEGRGLLGYLWRDPAKVPAGTPIPVYPLGVQEEGLFRTKLATSKEEYEADQRVGWSPVSPPGLVGYLCSQG